MGNLNRHESLTPSDCRHSLKALIAPSLSGLAGVRSSRSSVKLKSPNRRSGRGRFRFVHCSLSSVQNSWCLLGSFGAYTLIAFMVVPGCHWREIKIARPGIRVCSCTSSVLMISLLITKATPAEPDGLFVCGEFNILSLRWYRADVCSASCSVKWVSCSASSPILFSLMVLDTAVHLEIGPGPVVWDDRPFIFSVANLKFILYFWFGLIASEEGGMLCDISGVWGVRDSLVAGGVLGGSFILFVAGSTSVSSGTSSMVGTGHTRAAGTTGAEAGVAT